MYKCDQSFDWSPSKNSKSEREPHCQWLPAVCHSDWGNSDANVWRGMWPQVSTRQDRCQCTRSLRNSLSCQWLLSRRPVAYAFESDGCSLEKTSHSLAASLCRLIDSRKFRFERFFCLHAALESKSNWSSSKQTKIRPNGRSFIFCFDCCWLFWLFFFGYFAWLLAGSNWFAKTEHQLL